MSGHPDYSARNLALNMKKGDEVIKCYWRLHSSLKIKDENNNLFEKEYA